MPTLVGSPLQSVMATGSFSFLLLFACLFVSHSKKFLLSKILFSFFSFQQHCFLYQLLRLLISLFELFSFIVSFVFSDFILFSVDFHNFIIYFHYIIFVVFISYAFRINDSKKCVSISFSWRSKEPLLSSNLWMCVLTFFSLFQFVWHVYRRVFVASLQRKIVKSCRLNREYPMTKCEKFPHFSLVDGQKVLFWK